jgi:hypothetical protein
MPLEPVEKARAAEFRVSNIKLSEPTKKERRALLGVSLIIIAISRIGLLPSKISAIGIEFNQTDQHILLWILIIINGYFLFGWLINVYNDFYSWRKNENEFLSDYQNMTLNNIRQWVNSYLENKTPPEILKSMSIDERNQKGDKLFNAKKEVYAYCFCSG